MNIKEIKQLVSEVLNIPADLITDDSSIINIEEWDSLSHMTIILNIEKALSIQFSGEIIAEMTSIESIKKAIDSKIKINASQQ